MKYQVKKYFGAYEGDAIFESNSKSKAINFVKELTGARLSRYETLKELLLTDTATDRMYLIKW